MKNNKYGILGALIFLVVISHKSYSQAPSTKPVFTVDSPMPTADKPQSKLWYTENSWWALLPSSKGPSLWQRTGNGWKEHINISQTLKGFPAKADVWAEDKFITAVGVSDSSLTIFRLFKKISKANVIWNAKIITKLLPPYPSMKMETATIARDKTGRWWVTSIASDQVCVWSADAQGITWSEPVVVGNHVHEDDICAITPLQKGVAIIWSDQIRDAVVMREHQNNQPFRKWEKEEIIEQGGKTADDHIKTSLSDQGILWVATKNSLDEINKPQLVLRIRSSDGKWSNKPYANLEAKKMPTRPAVFVTKNSSVVLSGYGDNYTKGGSPYHSEITFGLIDTTSKKVLTRGQIVISPAPEYQDGYVQNITGPRNPFPAHAPWIILASDEKGRVYEADLRKWFSP